MSESMSIGSGLNTATVIEVFLAAHEDGVTGMTTLNLDQVVARPASPARFQILSRIAVAPVGGYPTVLTGRKIGTVMAALVTKANAIVSVDKLVDEVWGDHPPRRTVASLHVYVSQLRRLMGQSSGRSGPLITRAPGYMLLVGPGELDLDIYRELIDLGRSQFGAGLLAESSVTLQQALDLLGAGSARELGRGPVLTGLSAWLEESRLECIDLKVQADLALGRHRQLISGLYSLVSEYPLHESFYQYLMKALNQSNRRAEALAVYRGLRSRLVNELGIEPCDPVRSLQLAILKAESIEVAVPG
jgi:DNA-binding SARP family transcriptional activator